MDTTLTREPAAAGRFYPADPQELRELVNRCFLEASEEAPAPQVAALVAPHAGIIYSGATAAHAFARAKNTPIRRAILLGCSHYYRFPGASIVTGGHFKTPLGDFPIDTEFASALAKRLGNYPVAVHLPEHAIELLLPFLGTILGQIPIVPVLFGESSSQWHRNAGETLASMTTGEDLVVASTDLSHFLTEPEANAQDHQSLGLLMSHDVDSVIEAAETGACSMCGLPAVVATMSYCLERKATDWRLLDYRTSAKTSGDTSRVVGYAAVSMERAA